MPEIQVALDTAYGDPDRLVIPVRLKGAPKPSRLPAFVLAYHWLDLEELHLEELAARIKAVVDEKAIDVPTRLAHVPYRGLAPFEEEACALVLRTRK